MKFLEGWFSGEVGPWIFVLIGVSAGAFLLTRFFGRRRRRSTECDPDSPPLTVSVGHLGVRLQDNLVVSKSCIGNNTSGDGQTPGLATGEVCELIKPDQDKSVVEAEKTVPAVSQTMGSFKSVVEENGKVQPVFKGFVYCPFCGSDVEIGAQICSHCRSKLPEWPAEKNQPKRLSPILPETASQQSASTGNLCKPPPLGYLAFHPWRWFFAGIWLASISPMMKWLYIIDLFIIFRLWENNATLRALFLIGWAIGFPWILFYTDMY